MRQRKLYRSIHRSVTRYRPPLLLIEIEDGADADRLLAEVMAERMSEDD